MQQKKDSLGTTSFKEISYLGFFNLVPKELFTLKDTFSVKLIGV